MNCLVKMLIGKPGKRAVIARSTLLVLIIVIIVLVVLLDVTTLFGSYMETVGIETKCRAEVTANSQIRYRDFTDLDNLRSGQGAADERWALDCPSMPDLEITMRDVKSKSATDGAMNPGGTLTQVPDPVCPTGMSSFGQIFQMHNRDNTWGRKWAFCAVPGVSGAVNTCSVNSAADRGPWTQTCNPALCPTGTSSLTGFSLAR